MSNDPGTAATANSASGNPIKSPTCVSVMRSSRCTSGITGGMARIVMRMATPASQSSDMSSIRRPVERPFRLAEDVMEGVPGVSRHRA